MKTQAFSPIFIPFILMACSSGSSTGGTASTDVVCKGVYFDRNQYGSLRKWNEHLNSTGTACLLDQVALSTWEQSVENRRGQNVVCTPQVLDVSLISSGNYYAYRDNRMYLDLNGATGVYRRFFLGEHRDGRPTFTREEGCFWVRDGVGVDTGFGRQVLLDTTGAAATEPFVPAEIYRVDESGINFLFTRFDDKSDWGFTFCPDLRTPWEYCTEIRNGNLMYYPDLTLAIQASLTSEAVLIRTAFSFSSIARVQFDSVWAALFESRTESVSANWKYVVSHVVDTPRFTDGAWRDYVMGVRPTMPIVSDGNSLPTCFAGRQQVNLSNGSIGFVSGEICYANGQYDFVAN
ncbi:MAG: hypothetical protein K2X47_06845 [Bdellovibrionales bacterium]|nr:hypothetical protein [Bdellovibrionales bacterium]